MHKIIFSGKILPGHDPATVRDKLLSMLGLKSDQAVKLFSGKSHTLKKGLSAEEAKHYQERLSKRGIAVEIVPPLRTGPELQFPTLIVDLEEELPEKESSAAFKSKPALKLTPTPIKPAPTPTPTPTPAPAPVAASMPMASSEPPPAPLLPKSTAAPPAKRIPSPPHGLRNKPSV